MSQAFETRLNAATRKLRLLRELSGGEGYTDRDVASTALYAADLDRLLAERDRLRTLLSSALSDVLHGLRETDWADVETILRGPCSKAGCTRATGHGGEHG